MMKMRSCTGGITDTDGMDEWMSGCAFFGVFGVLVDNMQSLFAGGKESEIGGHDHLWKSVMIHHNLDTFC